MLAHCYSLSVHSSWRYKIDLQWQQWTRLHECHYCIAQFLYERGKMNEMLWLILINRWYFAIFKISAMCQNFQSLEIDGFVKRHILNGHNGLRNRFSKEYKVPNMNILHWDNDLAEMARGWVSQCTQRSDPLNYICSGMLLAK